MNFRSAFSQIIWLQMLAIAVVCLAIPAAIFVLLDQTAAAYQMRMLRQHEQGLMQAMSLNGQDLSLPAQVRAPYAQGVGGFAFSVVDHEGHVLLSSQTPPGPMAGAPAMRQATLFKLKIGEGSYYGASFPETVGGRPIWIQIGQNLENPDVVMDDVLARFAPMAGWGSVVLLLLLLGADVLIVRRAFQPILDASRQAEAITPSRIHVRLAMGRMPREIAPLIGAVNQALERLEEGFRAQRDLTADVAHDLRTPLAILRMRVEALSDSKIRARLEADIDVMSRIVAQLLAMAELEQVAVDDTDRADLRLVCLEAAEHLAPLAVAEGKRVELSGAAGPVWVRGKHDFLFQAVCNLLENAVAHTPAGAAAIVEVREDGLVRVLDRGPGVPVAQREMLFRRFWRRRDNPSAAGAGAGLGLSIVARIADSHSGSVRMEDRPGGGAVFILALPQARAA
jgi:signal transduction histidine kinase